MRTIRLVKISTLLAGILVFLGFSLPAVAGTCSVTLTKAHPQDSAFCQVISGEGFWTFTYTVSGNVNSLGLQIKNNPGAGSICWVGGSPRKPRTGDPLISTDPYLVPAAETGVCGFDFEDSNGDPLAVAAFIQTAPGGTLALTVTYPDP
jgi:hypothetical protein